MRTKWILLILGLFTGGISTLAWFDFFNFKEVAMLLSGFEYFGPLIYFLVYVSLVLFGFPSFILTIAAGLVFGITQGFFIDFFSSMVTAVIAFIGARYFNTSFDSFMSRTSFKLKIKNFMYKHARENAFLYMLILRFSFIPFIIVSYFAGLIRHITFFQFFMATLISNAIFGFLTIYFGYSLRAGGYDLIISSSLLLIVVILLLTVKKVKSYNISG